MGTRAINTVFVVLLLGIAAVIYALNRFTPLASDDWNYVFIFGTDDYIRNLWDVARSQYNHYFGMNGRVTAQSMVQIADSLLGKTVFDAVNTLAFLAFLYLIALNVTSDRRHYANIVLLAFVLVFLLIPEFNMSCLWLSGAGNYLWTAMLLLLFHFLLEQRQSRGKAVQALLFVYGVICGWTNEAFVVGMAGAYFIYYAIHWRRLTRHKVIMLAGFFIGAALLVFSPSSIHRASTDMIAHSKQQVLELLLSMGNLRLMFIALLVIPLLALFRQIKLGTFLKQELWLVLTIMLLFLFILATNHRSGHSRMGIEVFSMLLLFRALPWSRVGHAAIVAATIGALVVGLFAIQANKASYQANEEEFAQIRRHEYPIQTRLPQHANYLNRFIVPYSYNVMGDGFKTYGRDEFISKYFHNDSIYFLPRDFVHATQHNPAEFATFQTADTWPFYAKREQDASDKAAQYAIVHYLPYDYSRLSWPFSRIAPKLPGYNLNDVPVKIQRVTLAGTTYVLAEKNPDMHFRLQSITLMP